MGEGRSLDTMNRPTNDSYYNNGVYGGYDSLWPQRVQKQEQEQENRRAYEGKGVWPFRCSLQAQ